MGHRDAEVAEPREAATRLDPSFNHKILDSKLWDLLALTARRLCDLRVSAVQTPLGPSNG
jgi:hypothetical protein